MQPTHSQTLSRSELQIRPAHASDRAALEAIAAQTWDGDDYLPRVLDDWLADPYDGFFVATLHDQVVGVIKVTRFAEGEWWLEGLRIDPAYHGQGMSRILHHFAINQVRRRGRGMVRFSTASMNEAVQHLAAETGFERVGVFLPYGASVLAEPVAGLRRLDTPDLQGVRAWLDQSPHFERAARCVESDWSFYRLTRARLAERLAAGLIYGWKGGAPGDLGGVAVLNPTGKERWPGDPALKIGYFDAAPEALPALARDLRRLAAALGRVFVHVKPPDDPVYTAALDEAGYQREWDGAVWLFAREVTLTVHATVRHPDSTPGRHN